MLKKLLLLILIPLTTINAQITSATIPDYNNGKHSVAPLLKKTFPAVVNISIKTKARSVNPLMDDPFFKDFFKDFQSFQFQGNNKLKKIENIGSGVIINAKDGIIITNHHVIENADEIYITLRDSRRYQAKLIGSDKKTDIAILQIDAKNLSDLPFADINTVEVGDFVLAIGNPFGLKYTVTSGIVSGLGRTGLSPDGLQNYIQTDASINPGNSGGALINLKGQLVGINTAILSKFGVNIGIGFAVPADIVKSISEQIIKNGKVERGKIGAYVQNITQELATALKLEKISGALVSKIIANSAAEKAGLKTGDVIIAVDGRKIEDGNSFATEIGLRQINDKVKIDYIRNNKKRSTTVTIVKDTPIKLAIGNGENVSNELLLGIKIEEKQNSGKKQVLVKEIDPQSLAYKYGLRKNDIIFSINNQEIHSLKDFEKAVKKESNQIVLNAQRKNGALFIVIKK